MRRRTFLKAMGGAVGSGALAARSAAVAQETAVQAEQQPAAGTLPRRALGRTGLNVSLVGFPGLALARPDQQECSAAIQDAYRRGVNYFDVAPAYGNGSAEIKMGVGLQGIDRGSIVLACKTKMRDKQGAREELERSLERLKTDYFDLYQLHALIQPDEVEQALGPGGAIETLVQARKEGKVRHLGFSAHTTKAALRAMNGFRFDTVMFPINFVEFFTMGFGRSVLNLANKQGAAVLAIKPMCRGAWPEGVEKTRQWWYRPVEDEREINLALRFTLSQESVAAGLPPAFLDLVDKAIDVGRAQRPLEQAETRQLRKLAQSCESIFRRWEDQVAGDTAGWERAYPGCPHEGCPGAYA